MSDPETLRGHVEAAGTAGLSPLCARLTVLPRLLLARAREEEYVCRGFFGRLREIKLARVGGFWREFWHMLGYHLHDGDIEAAVALLDMALDRVEPPASPEGHG